MLATYHFDLLAGDSAAHVCAAGGREQGGVAELIDALLPCLGRILRRIDVLETLLVDELDRVLDPATLDLNRRWTVGEERWTVRAVQVEPAMVLVFSAGVITVHLKCSQVGVAGDGGTKVGVCAILPLVLQVCAVHALETHVAHAASDDVEARCQCDDVVFALLSVLCDDALLGKLLDRSAVLGIGVDVDDIDVVAVENLVVVLLETRALDAERMWWLFREEDLVLPLVLDTR